MKHLFFPHICQSGFGYIQSLACPLSNPAYGFFLLALTNFRKVSAAVFMLDLFLSFGTISTANNVTNVARGTFSGIENKSSICITL